MPENFPKKMIFRCYGYRTWQGSWIASCVDLSLMVERPSLEESMEALRDQIVLYVQSVLDTSDKDSIGHLLPRPVPWPEMFIYKFIATVCTFQRICRKYAFKFKEEYPVPQAA
jgi:hypothetical protein